MTRLLIPWTEEEDQSVRDGMADGLSSGVMAAAIDRTKNMVIRRIRALGLKPTPPPKPKAPTHPRVMACAVESPPPPVPLPPGVPLAEAGPWQCRWPLWDKDGWPDFPVCGKHGYPWCEEHSARAFGKPGQERRYIREREA